MLKGIQGLFCLGFVFSSAIQTNARLAAQRLDALNVEYELLEWQWGGVPRQDLSPPLLHKGDGARVLADGTIHIRAKETKVIATTATQDMDISRLNTLLRDYDKAIYYQNMGSSDHDTCLGHSIFVLENLLWGTPLAKIFDYSLRLGAPIPDDDIELLNIVDAIKGYQKIQDLSILIDPHGAPYNFYFFSMSEQALRRTPSGTAILQFDECSNGVNHVSVLLKVGDNMGVIDTRAIGMYREHIPISDFMDRLAGYKAQSRIKSQVFLSVQNYGERIPDPSDRAFARFLTTKLNLGDLLVRTLAVEPPDYVSSDDGVAFYLLKMIASGKLKSVDAVLESDLVDSLSDTNLALARDTATQRGFTRLSSRLNDLLQERDSYKAIGAST